MREVELKAIVPDEGAARSRLERAGARLTFEGRLEDRRYDEPSRRLTRQDQVLRCRTYRDAAGAPARAELDWKGRTGADHGYKVREELGTAVGDPDALAQILDRLGYVLIREIDRVVAQYELDGAVVRFERYPRLDILVEVEGEPDAIERAIAAMDIPRTAFSSARLPDFVAAYEARTGGRAALCARELAGDYRWGHDA